MAKLLSQVGFDEGAGQNRPVFDIQEYVVPEVRRPDEQESLADLKRQASALIEATVQSVNTRLKCGKRG